MNQAAELEREADESETQAMMAFEKALGFTPSAPVPDRPVFVATFKDLDRWSHEVGERAADDVPTVVHPVDDQSASRHGHRGDGVANILRHAALEVELLMLEAPEQAPELVGCELPGNVTEPRDGVHDEKYYQIFSKKLSTWNVS